MEQLFLLLILESLTIKDIAWIAVTVIGALWLWKSGLPQQLFQSSSKLVELRTTERDDALRDRDKWKTKSEEFESQVFLLLRELTQRREINEQDQAEIRELKKQIKAKENE